MEYDDSKFDVTLVTTGSKNRDFIMPIFASRWNGYFSSFFITLSPIVFVVHLKEEEVTSFRSFLKRKNSSILCRNRIQIITYVVRKGVFFYDNYPINILRNLGIRHVRTNHFAVLDIDMWMSGIVESISLHTEKSYEAILSLPSEIQSDPRTAVIIPAFFHTGWSIFNGTLVEQVNSYQSMSILTSSIIHRIPFSMKDLIQCQTKGKCSFVKNHLFTHVYFFDSFH